MSRPLLRARLSASYRGKPALRDVEIEISPGEILALIGQSGSGKSTLALAILGLLGLRGGSVSGRIEFRGEDLAGQKEKRLRQIRGREIGLVFQSASGALNPRMSVEDHLVEAWRAHAPGKPDLARLLEEVQLPGDRAFARRYPRELSVGQAQRVLIAIGITHRPKLLIADEPTSALDAITQAGILGLFARLNREQGMAILFITHDLLSVARLAHRVAILREGMVVEQGAVARIFESPTQYYTQNLIGALPRYPESLGVQLGNLGHILQQLPGAADNTQRESVEPGKTA